MTDKIKVWVPELNGMPVILPAYFSSEVLAWNDLCARQLRMQNTLVSMGWTVRPYVLAEGRYDD